MSRTDEDGRLSGRWGWSVLAVTAASAVLVTTLLPWTVGKAVDFMSRTSLRESPAWAKPASEAPATELTDTGPDRRPWASRTRTSTCPGPARGIDQEERVEGRRFPAHKPLPAEPADARNSGTRRLQDVPVRGEREVLPVEHAPRTTASGPARDDRREASPGRALTRTRPMPHTSRDRPRSRRTAGRQGAGTASLRSAARPVHRDRPAKPSGGSCGRARSSQPSPQPGDVARRGDLHLSSHVRTGREKRTKAGAPVESPHTQQATAARPERRPAVERGTQSSAPSPRSRSHEYPAPDSVAPGPAPRPVPTAPVPDPSPSDDAAFDSEARSWPVGSRPPVLRGWEPPSSPYGPGHRGVDLGAPPGTPVRTAAAGTVVYVGEVAGRGVVTVELLRSGSPPLRTTYEPVAASVQKGTALAAGEQVGVIETGGPFHCPGGCLHWGLLRGDVYLDPLSLLPLDMFSAGPSRLLPLTDETVTTHAGTASGHDSMAGTPAGPVPTTGLSADGPPRPPGAPEALTGMGPESAGTALAASASWTARAWNRTNRWLRRSAEGVPRLLGRLGRPYRPRRTRVSASWQQTCRPSRTGESCAPPPAEHTGRGGRCARNGGVTGEKRFSRALHAAPWLPRRRRSAPAPPPRRVRYGAQRRRPRPGAASPRGAAVRDPGR